MMAQIALNPQLPGEMKELAIKMASGKKLVMDKIVQTFDIKAVDSVVTGLLQNAGVGEARALGGANGAGPGAAQQARHGRRSRSTGTYSCRKPWTTWNAPVTGRSFSNAEHSFERFGVCMISKAI